MSIPTNCTFFNLKIYLLIPFHDDRPWCLNGQGDCNADNTATPMRVGMGYGAHPQILYVHFFENTFAYYLFLQATSCRSTHRPASISTGLRHCWHAKRQHQEGQKANNRATSQGTRAPGIDITEYKGMGEQASVQGTAA